MNKKNLIILGIALLIVIIATSFLGYNKKNEGKIKSSDQNKIKKEGAEEKLMMAFSGNYEETSKEIEKEKKHKEKIAKRPIVEIKDIENIDELVDGKYEFENVDISDWKTYRSEAIGIEMKIPKDWVCVEEKQRGIVGREKKIDDCECKHQDVIIKNGNMLKLSLMNDNVVWLGFNIKQEIENYRALEKDSSLYTILINDNLELLLDRDKSFMITKRMGNDELILSLFKVNENAKNIFDGIVQTMRFVK